MKITHRIYIVVLFSLITVACGKDEIVPSSLIGRWTWLSSSGGIAGQTYTPESTGEKRRIEYTIDSIFYEYQDEELVRECRFTIRKSVYGQDSVTYIHYEDGGLSNLYEFEKGDKLSLQDYAADGYTHLYRKIND